MASHLNDFVMLYKRCGIEVEIDEDQDNLYLDLKVGTNKLITGDKELTTTLVFTKEGFFIRQEIWV